MPINSTQVVTFRNERGMQDLLQLLGGNPAQAAAKRIYEDTRDIVICTGFPVNGAPETDGPPGTIALATALQELGKKVSVVSWPEANAIMKSVAPDLQYRDLPASGSDDSALIVTVEICSRTPVGLYLNMHGKDITSVAPKFEDYIGSRADVSIGDGGNEFGMGSAPLAFFETRTVVAPLTECEILVPATVSNFGAYAIVAELEILAGRDLLPAQGQQTALITALVKGGAVDGFSGEALNRVDGQELEETESILTQLRDYSTQARSGEGC